MGIFYCGGKGIYDNPGGGNGGPVNYPEGGGGIFYPGGGGMILDGG